MLDNLLGFAILLNFFFFFFFVEINILMVLSENKCDKQQKEAYERHSGAGSSKLKPALANRRERVGRKGEKNGQKCSLFVTHHEIGRLCSLWPW